MRVTMMLCDYAAVAEGKLQIIGGDWERMGKPAPHAVAILIQVPWDQIGLDHQFSLRLLDLDGYPVEASGPQGEPAEVSFSGDFRVDHNPELKPGLPASIPLAIGLGPLPLEPNSRYEWRLEIDGENEADWHLAFSTGE